MSLGHFYRAGGRSVTQTEFGVWRYRMGVTPVLVLALVLAPALTVALVLVLVLVPA